MPDDHPDPNPTASPAIDPIRTAPAGPRVGARADRQLIEAHARSERFLLIDLVAPSVPADRTNRRPPVNLGFVLDRSGSMGGQRKLGLARQATLEAIHRLDGSDRFAVVVYDDQVEVVVDGTEASGHARQLASDRLRTIEARNTTNLHGGWLAGCEQVAAGLLADGVNRVLLLTDGLANVGVIDRDQLVSAAYDLRRRGVTTSTFGVGGDFDEELLAAMADAGGGHFYFVGDVAQMRDHIASEVGETLETVAREVVLELTVPGSVRVDALSPFRVETRDDRVLVFLGDLVSGQLLSIVLRLTFDYGDVGREVGVRVRVADRDGAFAQGRSALDPIDVSWRYVDRAASEDQPRDRFVDRAVARLSAEQAKQDAVRLNRAGRYADAGRALEDARRRIAGYAGSDEELRRIAAELRDERPAYAAPMPELARKARYFAANTSQHMRTPEGRSRRS